MKMFEHNTFADNVRESIWDRMIDACHTHNVSISDLMDNYDGHVERLKQCDRYMHKYDGRESRLYVKAWQGVKREYEL